MTCERTHDVTRSDEIRAQTPIPTKQMATNAAIAPQHVSAKLPVLKKRRQEKRDQPADDDQRTADSEDTRKEMMTVIKVAQDLAASWERARPERRKQLVAELFETIRIGDGRIVSVKPKPAVMPLIAVTVGDAQTKDWRSRPDSNRRSRP